MSDSPSIQDALSNINVVVQNSNDILSENGDDQEKQKKDPAEEWKLNKAAIRRFANDSNWPEALKLLKVLSTKHRNKEIYKALAQRVWICLKSDAPSPEVVLSLFHLLNTLGAKHEVAGPIVALAHLMAKKRTPDHKDSDLAMGQAQQMFNLVCETIGVVGEDAFKKWVETNKLDDPGYYVPIVMHCLDIMVGDDWWFDREKLQQEMEDANNKKLQAEAGHA